MEVPADGEAVQTANSHPEREAVVPEELAAPTEPAARIAPGSRIKLVGLQGRPELNGCMCDVIRFDKDIDRYIVKLVAGGNTFRCKVENLKVAKPAPGEAATLAESVSSEEKDQDEVEEEEEVPCEAPWLIDVNSDTPVPVSIRPNKDRGQAEEDSANAGGWSQDFLNRLAPDADPILAQVWTRWTRQADVLANQLIRSAFHARVAGHLCHAAERAPNGELRAMLAHAGSDTADHEATMRHVQQIIKEEHPAACVARVGPEDFKSLIAATRQVCEQLMHSSHSGAGTSGNGMPKEFGDGGEGDADDCDWWPEDPEGRQAPRRVGMMDFVDWHQERGDGAGLAVLLVERVEAVPNHLLLDVLRRFGSACCNSGIPSFVILGLQQPPQSRFELFEGEPLIPLRIIDAVCLFESSTVCQQLLERLAEDPSTLPIAPSLLLWLRNQFLYTRRSVASTLRALAMLCQEHIAERPLARFACRLGCAETDSALASRSQMTALFAKRVKGAATPGMMNKLRDIWAHLCQGIEDQLPLDETSRDQALDDAIREQVVQAAADAVLWRRRLCSSYAIWDVLLCQAQPMARHEARMWRLFRLAKLLWPQAPQGSQTSWGETLDGEGGVASLVEAERRNVEELVQRCCQQVFKEGDVALGMAELRAFHEELRNASSDALDETLRRQLEALGSPSLEEKDLRQGLCQWFEKLHETCWQPLTGAARSFFLGYAVSQAGLEEKIVRRLSGTKTLVAEALLGPLAIGKEHAGQGPSDDLTLLWRLLQGSFGRRVELSDLWRAYSGHVAPEAMARNGQAYRRRFGLALAALHNLGLHVPSSVGGGASAKAGSWRIHKRFFGRIWRGSKGKSAEDLQRAAAFRAAATVAAAAGETASVEGAVAAPPTEGEGGPDAQTPPAVPVADAFTVGGAKTPEQAFVTARAALAKVAAADRRPMPWKPPLPQPRGEKRPAAWSQEDGARRNLKGRKPKIFMGE